jgi:hypothetical protein
VPGALQAPHAGPLCVRQASAVGRIASRCSLVVESFRAHCRPAPKEWPRLGASTQSIAGRDGAFVFDPVWRLMYGADE